MEEQEDKYITPYSQEEQPLNFNGSEPEEKREAPYSGAALGVGIASIALGSIVLGIIGIVLADKGTTAYWEQPSSYKGEQKLKVGKTLSIIGIIRGVVSIIYVLVQMN